MPCQWLSESCWPPGCGSHHVYVWMAGRRSDALVPFALFPNRDRVLWWSSARRADTCTHVHTLLLSDTLRSEGGSRGTLSSVSTLVPSWEPLAILQCLDERVRCSLIFWILLQIHPTLWGHIWNVECCSTAVIPMFLQRDGIAYRSPRSQRVS